KFFTRAGFGHHTFCAPSSITSVMPSKTPNPLSWRYNASTGGPKPIPSALSRSVRRTARHLRWHARWVMLRVHKANSVNRVQTSAGLIHMNGLAARFRCPRRSSQKPAPNASSQLRQEFPAGQIGSGPRIGPLLKLGLSLRPELGCHRLELLLQSLESQQAGGELALQRSDLVVHC